MLKGVPAKPKVSDVPEQFVRNRGESVGKRCVCLLGRGGSRS